MFGAPRTAQNLHNLAERELWRETGIQVHTGKIHVWTKFPECDAMQRWAVVNNRGWVQRFQHAGILTNTPEPHVAFCPIFIFKFVSFLSVVALVSVALSDSSPRPSAEKRWNLAAPSSSLVRTLTIELPESRERCTAKTMLSVFFEKALPVEGRQRFHENTAYAHLWGFSHPFCLLAASRQCSAEKPAEGPKVGLGCLVCLGCSGCLGCLGLMVKVSRELRVQCGVLGVGCGRRGFTRQPENSKRAHLSAPVLQTPPKFHENTPREGRKEPILWRESEKKAQNFGPPHHWTSHPPTTTQHTQKKPEQLISKNPNNWLKNQNLYMQKKPQFWPKSVWPKSVFDRLDLGTPDARHDAWRLWWTGHRCLAEHSSPSTRHWCPPFGATVNQKRGCRVWRSGSRPSEIEEGSHVPWARPSRGSRPACGVGIGNVQNTLSSKNDFIHSHFHPNTISSNDTFIQKLFHPKNSHVGQSM